MSILYNWVASVIDQPLNPDGRYGNQCVDTIDHFGEFIFGVPWPQCVGGVGGANELLDVAPDKYWTRIDYYHGFIPQQFDVLVFAGDSLNQFGHTAVTWYATETAIDVIQQDGFAYPWQFVDGNYYSAKPAHYYTLHYSQKGTGPLLGVLRPRPEMLIQTGAIASNGSVVTTPATEDGDIDMAGKDDVINYIKTIFFGQYELGGRTDNPGLAYVMVETQKRQDRTLALLQALPSQIWWGVTVERDGKKIPAIQEMANIRSEQMGQGEVLVQIADQTTAEAFAEALPAAQAQAFVDALIKRIQDGAPEDAAAAAGAKEIGQ